MIEKKMIIDSVLKAKAELTIQYNTEFSARRCVVELEHLVNLNDVHGLMCCDHPKKFVAIEEGYKLRITFKCCSYCDKCKLARSLSSFSAKPVTLTKRSMSE